MESLPENLPEHFGCGRREVPEKSTTSFLPVKTQPVVGWVCRILVDITAQFYHHNSNEL